MPKTPNYQEWLSYDFWLLEEAILLLDGSIPPTKGYWVLRNDDKQSEELFCLAPNLTKNIYDNLDKNTIKHWNKLKEEAAKKPIEVYDTSEHSDEFEYFTEYEHPVISHNSFIASPRWFVETAIKNKRNYNKKSQRK
jgi:hypothetical protein